MTRAKICGLRRVEDILAVNEVRPDYAGCILAAGFKRTIDRDVAIALRSALLPEIPLVGVFVNDAPESIIAFLKDGIIDIAQLHGQESEEQIRMIQQATGKPVWKTIQMTGEIDYAAILASPAELVLLDAGAGSGRTFDWSRVRAVTRPFILAGGLTVENVTAAIEEARPFAVDTSSGVETDGGKDAKKIYAFVQAVRRNSHE